MTRLAPLAALLLAVSLPGCAAAPAAVAFAAIAGLPGEGANPDGDDDEAEPAPRPEPPGAAPPPAASAAPSTGGAPDVVRLEVLPAQPLPPGACGLFLFSRAEPPEFVFFAGAESGEALIRVSSASVALRQIAETATNDASLERLYAGPDGLEARLRATLGETLSQGRRVPEASLRLVRPGGGAVVAPLTGLTACAGPEG